MTPHYIITGNVGDSRAVLRTCSERGQTIGLNRDHNYQLPDEVVRVEKAVVCLKGQGCSVALRMEKRGIYL